MNIKSAFTILLLSTLIFCSCKDKANREVKTEEVSFKKEGELQIIKSESDSVLLELNIEIADNEYETQTGLMYRSGMEANQAMLFVFPNVAPHSFYMKNTEFALDLLFVKEDMTIGSITENAKPFDQSSIPSRLPVQYVLEVNAGLVSENGIEIGDRIQYTKTP
ncbi:MAG: hypothetical protein CML04_08210 [Pseudozobellia sp.]|nr:hypothetical protein [Pseudozobellia sp.]MBG47775.1 hypothetical protein [Pseudozobellia sp.]|tara:strand:- start:214 stop:705 length:492 start_codon:yes stop_codon:yes gene_type:complete